MLQSLRAQTDSIRQLQLVMVKGFRFSDFQTGSFSQTISLENNNNLITQSIHQSLSLNSALYIKNGGPSLLASSSSRGSTAQQTSTVWCGIPIESPLLGQTDLAVIPAFLFDGLAVLYGAQSSLFGSGNIGGSIQLNHTKQLQKGFHAQLLLQLGSFNAKSTGIKLSYGGKKLSTQFKFLHQNALNNFEFEWPSIGKQYMQHAASEQNAIMYELNYLPNPTHSLAIKTWLQNNQRLIPDIIGATIDNAEQKNQFIRNVLEYKFNQRNYQLQARTAIFNEIYTYSSESTPSSKTQFFQLNEAIDQIYSLKQHKFLLSGQYLFVNAFTANYNTDKMYVQPSLLGSIQSKWFHQTIETQLNIRKQWYNQNSLPLIPSFGLNCKLTKWISMNGNIASAFRMPTLNDLYWNPGGNENLKPEQSKSIEMGVLAKQNGYQLRLNAYHRICSNQITWIPNATGIWQAQNIQEVDVKGLETFWQIEKKWNTLLVILKGQHDYCLALNKSDQNPNTFDKQLLYVPKIKHLLQVGLVYKNWQIEYIHQYIGKRFYTSDNSEALSDYQLGNLFLQNQCDLKQLRGLALQIGIQNCWNQQYQNLLNRPMPGRQYNLTITYQF